MTAVDNRTRKTGIIQVTSHCVLLFFSVSKILPTTLLWRRPAFQWFVKSGLWCTITPFILLFHGPGDFWMWTFGLILEPFVSILWRIEKLCSLTNCISPHLARPHVLHEYLIMDVCWIRTEFLALACAHVRYALACCGSGEAPLNLFLGLVPHLCVLSQISLDCTQKKKNKTICMKKVCNPFCRNTKKP